jgi:methenyltetrahydrofolate cyclohydrolase
LSKETDEEKAKRSEAIHNAAIKAAFEPLKNGQRCRRIYELCLMLKGKSNLSAGSDLAVAELLSGSAVMGCAFNINANLSLIKDENIRSEFEKQSSELKQMQKS